MSDDMMGDFQIEASEILDEAEDSLLLIDKGADFSDCYNKLFRAFHSIKGASGMFGIEKLQKHMHHLENLLSSKEVLGTFSTEFIDYLFNGVDSARKILSGGNSDFEYIDPDSSDSEDPLEESPESHDGYPDPTTSPISMMAREPRHQFDGEVWAVDDEPDILEIIETILERENYKVKTFISPNSLLQELDKGSPDTIISDIQMPELNGIDLVAKVNEKRPHLPVIVLSGFVTKEVCIEVLAAGVAGIIEKPFNNQSFVDQVKHNVSRYQNMNLMNKSVDLLIYQFENFPRKTEEEQIFFERYKQELKLIFSKRISSTRKLAKVVG